MLLCEEVHRLRRATGETFALASTEDSRPIVIDAAPGHREPRVVSTLGSKWPLTTSGVKGTLADPPVYLAFGEERTMEGMSAVSAAFRQKSHRDALTAIGPADRFRQRRDTWITGFETTRAMHADRLKRNLGFQFVV